MTRFSSLAVACVAVLFYLFPAGAVCGGKPGPVTPPVQYRLQWLGTCGGIGSEARDINNNGDIVGIWWDADNVDHAFVYWHSITPAAVNLDIEPLCPGWSAISAIEINDLGDIVGTAINIGGQERAFRYRLADNTCKILPTVEGYEQWDYRGYSINSEGDVAGNIINPVDGTREVFLYQDSDGPYTMQHWNIPSNNGIAALNNNCQILTLYSGYRYDGAGNWEYFANHETRGMNENGEFVGRGPVPPQRRIRFGCLPLYGWHRGSDYLLHEYVLLRGPQ